MNPLSRLLNNVTMYRLVVYGLGALAGVSLIVSAIGRLSSTPLELIISLLLLLGSAFGTNILFSRIWNVPTNRETWIITALILFFVLQPADDLASGLALVLAGGVSSIVKFIIAPFGKHIFNPAAFAAAVVSLVGILPSTWWVGTSALWPFTLVLAVLVIVKIRRYALALTFVAVVVVVQSVQFLTSGQPLLDGLTGVFTASPLLFLGGIMLTEPSTMPPTRTGQSVFGAIVGALFVLAPEFGPFIVYPEVALLIGNAYAFIVSPKRRYVLTLQRIERISARVYNYVFTSHHPVAFTAGQYMEWTLPGVAGDGRGNRRSFTIASSPTEDTVQVGLKYYDPSSTYKYTLSRLRPGDHIFAGQISGSFTLTGLHNRKLLFIAGGVGVTPFRSMIKQLIDVDATADIVLLYSVAEARELAYLDIFNEASAHGVRFVPFAPDAVPGSGIRTDRIDASSLRDAVPDILDRTVMISGPNAMVQATKRELRHLGVSRTRIHTDYFSGY